ncbi:MAG TPA: AMP-binding protein, partial [Anaerolineaceae bacterium]|nr:AMP-binding protein [Anaerolineaceae bacterium]
WLHTGDIARMDADGYFYLVGRKKELIKVSGYQVWPAEVESVIIAHPAVKEVGVAGVPDEARAKLSKPGLCSTLVNWPLLMKFASGVLISWRTTKPRARSSLSVRCLAPRWASSCGAS